MMFPWNTTNSKWKRVYSQFLSPMIQLYKQATAQTGGTTRSVQRDLIPLVKTYEHYLQYGALWPMTSRLQCSLTHLKTLIFATVTKLSKLNRGGN